MSENGYSIRVGIVGAGMNARQRHIPELQKTDGVEVVAVANRRRETAEAAAGRFHIETVFDRWEDLVASPDIDAVVIGTWPYLHAPVTLAALDAGKHVLCEARMAMDLEQAIAMRDAARAHPELITQVVPSPYTLRVDRTIQRLIQEGFLGDLLAVEIRSATGEFVDPHAPLHWRQNVELSGINMLSLGIWYEAMLRWTCEAERVSASGKIFVKTRHDPLSGEDHEVKVPDHLVVSADLVCGAQAMFMLSSVTGGAAGNDLRLFGSEGSIRFRDDLLSVFHRNEDRWKPYAVPHEEGGGWRVEKEFIGAIRGEEPIRLTSFEDGVKYMAFTDAAARSLDEKRSIPVPSYSSREG